MVLHTTWRGQVDRTTDLNGALSTCTWPANTPGCISVDWPGLETNYFNARPAGRYEFGPKSWYGDLVQNNEDASRQQYMRNRYYDANTGRFTQGDPIGISGGMNLYGFAGGDHVNYSDPFGLAPCSLWPWSSRRCTWKDFKENVALFWHRLRTEPEQREMGLRGAAMMFSAGDAGLMMGPAPGYTVVIGKTTTLSSPGLIMAGQRTLVPQLAGDLGSNAANWARNERVLLQEMAAGNPIRDASVNPATGALIEDTGFLARERSVLRSRGWTYNPRTRLWNAPR